MPLRFGHALSCFNHVNDEPVRSLRAKFALVRAAGCTDYQIDLPLDWPLEEVLAEAADAGMTCVVVNEWMQDLGRFDEHLATAKRLGAQYYNHHVPTGLVHDMAGAARTIRDLQRRCADVGITYCAETHRGTLTQSLERTYELLGRVPGLRLWGDLSHYIIRGETYDQLADLYPHLAGLHLRVANIDHVQPEIIPGVTKGLAEFEQAFKAILATGFDGPVVAEGISWFMSLPRHDLPASNRTLLELARGWADEVRP